MCGIVAVAGKITSKLDSVFKTLLVLDAVRGIDSTGIAAISRGGDGDILKQVGNPYELMDMPKFGKLIGRMNRVLIGHNRYATQGIVSKANAHPFEFESVIGVHNGTLTNKWKLDDASDFKVDSQNLYHHINKNGLEHAINICEGAWSLVWWDKYEENINFLRNKERPMWIARTKDDSAIIAASESWMIDVACMREGVEIKEILSTRPDIHYSFVVDKECKLFDPETVEVEGAYVHEYKGGFALPFVKPEAAVSAASTSTVVSLPKARETSPNVSTPVLVSSDGMYSGSSVTLEIIKEERDQNGARYAVCYDADMPTTKIRLYLKKEDNFNILDGKEISATIGKYHLRQGQAGYYKVDYNTFKLLKPVRKEDHMHYANPDGLLLSKVAWEAAHGSCAWCSAAVFADEEHKFTVDGDTLCKVCCHDPEIMQLVH